MNKIYLSLLIGLMILPIVTAFDNPTVSPQNWETDYEKEGIQPTKIFTFSNPHNESVTVTVANSESQITFSRTSFSIEAGDTRDVTFYVDLPDNIAAGNHVRYVTYSWDDGTGTDTAQIPIIIDVNETAEEDEEETVTDDNCRIDPLVTNFFTTIKTSTAPFTKRFSVSVSNKCKEQVNIKTPIINGVTETSEGSKPIDLSGSLSLGYKDPGDEAYFEVEFNVRGLDTGIYSPSIIIPATYKGEKINTQIEFEVKVTGTLTPIGDSDDLKEPKYTVPAQVRVRDEFDITIEDLDPNLQPQIFFNPDLIGVGVTREEDVWTWRGYINQTGTYDIQMGCFYYGGQIGPVKTLRVLVVEQYGTIVSGSMNFDLYPKEDKLFDGANVSVLVRDDQNIVESAILYINGVRDDDKTFIFKKGTKYQLSATHPNYATIDKMLEMSVQERTIYVTVNPSDLESSDSAMVTVSDSNGITITGASITYDNINVIDGMFTAGTPGNHILEVDVEGFDTITNQISVSPPTIVQSSPEKLKKNEEAIISLSRAVDWVVQYQAKDKPMITLAQGTGQQISITPEEGGLYNVLVRNKQVKSYELASSWSPSLKWSWWYLVIVAIIGIIIYLTVFYKPRSGGNVGYGLPPGGNEVVSQI